MPTCTFIGTWKEAAEMAEAIATTVAIGIGGFWAYLRFVRNRLRYPRAEMTHDVFEQELAPGKTLLHVTTTIHNRGDVLLPIEDIWTRVSKVSPLGGALEYSLKAGEDLVRNGESEIQWPEIGCREIKYERGNAEIEPGESEKFHFDFLAEESVKTVQVYSYFENSRKKRKGPIGWAFTSHYNLADKGASNVNQTGSTEEPSNDEAFSQHTGTTQEPAT